MVNLPPRSDGFLPPNPQSIPPQIAQDQMPGALSSPESASASDADAGPMHQRSVDILYQENGGQPYVSTSLRHFANVQASTILSGSAMEGVKIEDTLAYWLRLFHHWSEGRAQPVDPGLSKQEIQTVLNSLQDCLEFKEIFKGKDPTHVISRMQDKLSARKECFLPVGWKGVPGHFMLAKFRDKGDFVAIELLTKGGGAEFHDKFSNGTKKTKVSYKSDTIVIDKKLLFESKLGQSFFKRLMEIQDDSVQYSNMSLPFEGTDLYGLCNLLKEASSFSHYHSENPQRAKIGVTDQRGGNCTDTGLRMTLYEAIFETDPMRTSKDFKRSMHAFKAQSLVDGFRQFRQEIERGEGSCPFSNAGCVSVKKLRRGFV